MNLHSEEDFMELTYRHIDMISLILGLHTHHGSYVIQRAHRTGGDGREVFFYPMLSKEKEVSGIFYVGASLWVWRHLCG